MVKTYDFIVVGAGPAGCAVARRLADSAQRPEVLLLEAGSDNRRNVRYRSSKLRFALALVEPKVNWGYRTTKQPHLNNRRINQARGKGLGGTSGINFAIWLVGSDEDYNGWAALTGDDAWKWPAVHRRLQKVENVNPAIATEPSQYLDSSGHSTNGQVGLSYPKLWDPNVDPATFAAAESEGLPISSNLNSGDPIGIGLAPISYNHGSRISAAEAYLSNTPINLTIIAEAATAKVLFKGKQAVGVQTVDGREFRAKHEVIISAGALNTPQILMLSGIGPTEELNKHNIPITQDLPGVGKHLIDHLYVPIIHLLTPAAAAVANPTEPDPEHDAGPQCPAGFLRIPHLNTTPEFQSLPPATQHHLNKPTVPHYEIMVTGSPFLTTGSYKPKRTDRFRTVLANLMNLQSEGSVTLTSTDPTAAPVIDGNYFSHPFDRRLAIESLRAAASFASQPAFASTTAATIVGPSSTSTSTSSTSASDEELFAFWQHHGASLFHMGGTAKMGRYNDPDPTVCVDPGFRVRGVTGLRVVDMSVAPTLPCGHTQSTAYLVGETAAEKMIEEYGLDRKVGHGRREKWANL